MFDMKYTALRVIPEKRCGKKEAVMNNRKKHPARRAYRSLASIVILLALCISGVTSGRVTAYADSAFTPKTISDSSVNKTDTVTAGKKSPKSIGAKFRVAYSQTALNLLNQAIKKNGKGKNILMSPDSILTALGMTELGAKGKTQQEMVKGLGQGI